MNLHNRLSDYLCIFLLLLLTGCDNPECMTQSEALPLQWVPEGKKTFNETKHCGIEHKCYFQPWRCDVDVVDQFTDTTLRDYVLRAFDKDGEQLFEKTYDVANFNLAPELQDWTMIAGSDVNWTGIGTSSPQVYLGSSGAMGSNRIKSDLALSTGKTYRIYYTITCDQIFWKMRLRFRVSGSATTPLPSDITGTSGVNTGYVDVTVDVNTDDMTLEVFKTTGGPLLFEVNQFSIYDTDLDNQSVVYSTSFNPDDEEICGKLVSFELWDVTGDDVAPDPIRISRTDLMQFKESDCIAVFDYESNVDYAGLVYEMPTGYESPIFKLCVEGVFAHDREVTEEVTVELTDEVIGTATSLKTQKLLSVQDAPDFFHKKTQMMLAHSLIGKVTDENYNRVWVKEEKYDKQQRDPRYIFKFAECWLTDGNDLNRGSI